jgi:hypothetical protein
MTSVLTTCEAVRLCDRLMGHGGICNGKKTGFFSIWVGTPRRKIGV